MANEKAPKKIILRTYQVGFGDCFLLIFQYPDETEKFILFDFGTTGLPDGFPSDQMVRVAKNIKERCKDKLDVIVATHRHKDHISGFSTEGGKESSGEIIASCNPDLVIQPWTESPTINQNARESTNLIDTKTLQANEKENSFLEKSFSRMLSNMHNVAQVVKSEGERLGKKLNDNGVNGGGFVQPIDEKTKNLLKTMGENNIKNKSAVENLAKIGKDKSLFVNYGSDLSKLEKLLGIKAYVLGPPTIQQYEKVMKQRSRDEEEFWMITASLQNYWKLQSATANLTEDQLNTENDLPSNPFPTAKIYDRYAPSHTRWFIRRMRNLRGDQLLSIVTILDKAMNNTSVILLLDVGGKKLLFPGDAQIENWEYVLKHKQDNPAKEKERLEYLKLLKDTTLYKVGHHGSRNATPKTLWNSFAKKASENKEEEMKKAMHTVVSTMEGKHGNTDATKVPRQTLVNELKTHSQYRSTQEITHQLNDGGEKQINEKDLFFEIEI